MKNTREIIQAILKAVALGMSVASFLLGALGTVEVSTQVALLSVGLIALVAAGLQKH